MAESEFVEKLFEIRHHIEDQYGASDYSIESTNIAFMRELWLTSDDSYWEKIAGVKVDSCSVSSGVYRIRPDSTPYQHWNVDGTSMSVAVSASYKINKNAIIGGHVIDGLPNYPSSPNAIVLPEYGANVWLLIKPAG